MRESRNTAVKLGATLVLLVLSAASAQEVIDSVDVGGAWVYSLCYNSAADVVYGATQSGDRIFAIDCATDSVISSFWAEFPFTVCYDSTDNKAYCTRNAQGVVVIDGNTHQRVREIALDEANVPVWDAASDRLYVSCTANNEIAVIDCRTDSVVARIAVPDDPVRMYINPLRRKLYALGSESVSILDMAANQLIRTLWLGSYQQAGSYVPSVDKFYCEAQPSRVVAIDGESDSVVGSAPASGALVSFAWSAAHNRVMVGADLSGRDTIYVLDPACDSMVRALSVGGGVPQGQMWVGHSDLVYCASSWIDSVIVTAGDGSHIERALPVGDCPYALAYAPEHRRVYVSHLSSSKVYVIKDPVGISEGPAGAARRSVATTTVFAGTAFQWTGEPAVLLDVAGRAALRVQRGENDLSRLAPGVYTALRDGEAVCTRIVKIR